MADEKKEEAARFPLERTVNAVIQSLCVAGVIAAVSTAWSMQRDVAVLQEQFSTLAPLREAATRIPVMQEQIVTLQRDINRLILTLDRMQEPPARNRSNNQ